MTSPITTLYDPAPNPWGASLNIQRMVELEYVRTGNELISANLASMQGSLSAMQSILHTLGTIQDLHNKLEIPPVDKFNPVFAPPSGIATVGRYDFYHSKYSHSITSNLASSIDGIVYHSSTIVMGGAVPLLNISQSAFMSALQFGTGTATTPDGWAVPASFISNFHGAAFHPGSLKMPSGYEQVYARAASAFFGKLVVPEVTGGSTGILSTIAISVPIFVPGTGTSAPSTFTLPPTTINGTYTFYYSLHGHYLTSDVGVAGVDTVIPGPATFNSFVIQGNVPLIPLSANPGGLPLLLGNYITNPSGWAIPVSAQGNFGTVFNATTMTVPPSVVSAYNQALNLRFNSPTASSYFSSYTTVLLGGVKQSVVTQFNNARNLLAQQMDLLRNFAPNSDLLSDLSTVYNSMPTGTGSTLNTAIISWLKDNYGSSNNRAGAIQTDISQAINSAQSLNTTQQEKVKRYLFVFEEFYKSASAVLTAINQIITHMASNINR